MGTFHPYKGSAWTIRQFDKFQGTKTNIHAMLMAQAAELNSIGESTDCTLVIFEIVHYSLSHKIINVSKNIAERFLSSKMKLAIDGLRLPNSIFEICFEDGLKIPGTDIQMPSCLVIAKVDEATVGALNAVTRSVCKRQIDVLQAFREAAGLKKFDYKHWSEIDPKLPNMFSVKYRDPLIPDGELVGPICHGNINFSKAEGMTVDEVIDGLPMIKHGHITPMDDRDKYIQKSIFTTVLATLCYMNTKNPDAKPYKFPDRPRLGTIPPDAIVVGQAFDRCPPGWHLRSAHFRKLEHERFQRNEEGKAKIIWVRSAEVGKGQEPAGMQPKEELIVK